MANKRIFEIAKELGIKSKAIVEKCHAEGIPKDVIKNHMSSVSIGLEQTIREWFANETEGEENPHTAVEQAEKVDIEKVRAKKKASKKADADADDSSDDESASSTSTAVAEPPLKAAKARPAAAAPAPEEEPEKATKPEQAQQAQQAAPVETPEQPAMPKRINVPAGLSSEPPKVEAPVSKAPAQSPTPAAKADDNGEAPAVVRPPAPDIKGPSQPPQMNVPTRPKTIAPAGPQLEKKEQIKLSGPKVVRVEAPEQVEAPRRRPPRGPGGGNFGGGGAGVPMEGRPPRGAGNARRRGGDRRDGPDLSAGRGWTAADLAEREARLQRSGGYLKQRQNQMRSSANAGQTPAKIGGKVTIAAPFSIKDLSAATGVKGADIVKKLFMQGVMATINSAIDSEKAQEIMIDWDIELEVAEAKNAEEQVAEQFAERERKDERARGPIVTILGHVDHGKTSLLDRIRNANVADGEAGGITQATSAFRVPVTTGDNEKFVTFIDTPGHEAFTAMRSRGANVTDIVVLVVAADDGVMPQTIESISHSKAAGVPIIVALNKIDKEQATDANIQRILGQLAEHGLNPTDWGGDTEIVRTSAIKGTGIQELLEILDLQAEVLELKSDFSGQAQGTVIEARPEGGRGNVANILVQEGQLSVGDFIVMGRAFGRVRDITDDRGNKLKSVLPPLPVQISGINDLPDAGDKFYCVSSIKEAEKAAEQRRDRERETQLSQPKLTLDNMFSQIAEMDLKEILVVLKADVQGSVDVLRSEIEKVGNEEVKVRVIHSAVGGITESDILLAEASKAIIIGFNVIANAKGRALAEDKGVEIRNYQVIYHIVEDMRKAVEGLLTPDIRQEVLGHAEVRQVFKVSKVGAIAGCYVTDGVVQRDAFIRVTRDDVIVEDNRKLEQLKRFKDDAKEVRANMECGMKIVGYDDIKEGDVLECYKNIEVKRTLD
ncbi:MAG: translation initiation factor IF-2 [Phycisphaerae bacterium]|nr:translation initiation factor IF-2 [Phycisphaerae bacterium]MBM93101.1 translation initiation factor IF-2 [Phycisphaerae bacterium]